MISAGIGMKSSDQIKHKQSGFTIIEVVLVLAIAGLIFLVVFLAVPQLQQSRRDSQRKNDAAKAIAGLRNYAANNSGSYPVGNNATTWNNFVSGYLDNFVDPSTGVEYVLTDDSIDDPDTPGLIWYHTSRMCRDDHTFIGTGNPRDVGVILNLESGGYFCLDNS